MTLLDCQSFDTALESVAGVLGLAPTVLLERVKGYGAEDAPAADRHEYPFHELLARHVTGGGELPAPGLVHWFHATRVPTSTTFAEGLLPSSQALPRLWDALWSIAQSWHTREEWERFREEMPGYGGHQYQQKLANWSHERLDDGPHAFLVRDVILKPIDGNRDFLCIPEVIADICASYAMLHPHPLAERYRAMARPCIVKFRAVAAHAYPGFLRAALLYLNRVSRGEDLYSYCNASYADDGRTVPAEDIVEVQWPGVDELGADR